MLGKLMFLTVVLVLLAGGLLVFRQHRLEMANQNATLYKQMQASRHEIWSSQTRCAHLLEPKSLQKRISQARLAMEPYDPYKPADGARPSVASASPR